MDLIAQNYSESDSDIFESSTSPTTSDTSDSSTSSSSDSDTSSSSSGTSTTPSTTLTIVAQSATEASSSTKHKKNKEFTRHRCKPYEETKPLPSRSGARLQQQKQQSTSKFSAFQPISASAYSQSVLEKFLKKKNEPTLIKDLIGTEDEKEARRFKQHLNLFNQKVRKLKHGKGFTLGKEPHDGCLMSEFHVICKIGGGYRGASKHCVADVMAKAIFPQLYNPLDISNLL